MFNKDNRVVIEFNAVANNYWAWMYVLALPSNTDTTTNLWMVTLSSSYDSRLGKINVTYFPYNTSFASVKLVKDGTTLTVYVNDVLKGTATDVDLTDYPCFALDGSYKYYIKNIRIKPYSEV